MTKYGYKITAFKDGKKLTLAQYTGDDSGLYRFELERFRLCGGDDCCGDEEVSPDGEPCTCGSECQCEP